MLTVQSLNFYGPYFKIPHDLAPTWLQGIDVSLTFYSCLVVKSDNGQGVIHYTNGVRYKPMHHIIIRRLKKSGIYTSTIPTISDLLLLLHQRKKKRISTSTKVRNDRRIWAGSWFNLKILPSISIGNPMADSEIRRSSYLHNGNSYTGKSGGCPPENFEKSKQNGGTWRCLWHCLAVKIK